MKVLLVDDEVGLTHAIARGLRAEGHAVDLAHDGISGRDAALRGGYDVVLSPTATLTSRSPCCRPPTSCSMPAAAGSSR